SQAKVIHYPLCGWLNPLQRPEIDLTPVGDPRYRFYDFGPKKSWSASAADIEELWRPHRHQTLDSGALGSLRDKAQSRIALKRAWVYAKKELQARLLRSGALV
ncbi:hypothetical protein DOI34_25665, partial [Salmonella enterica subsp. enterica serovar Virchow]|nr:hypothetical protein [Salmonella enterica subsp. enterica serovar Virchow]